MLIRSVRTLLFALAVLCASASAFAQVGVLIAIAPPPLPVYEQPLCPGEGYIWTPGYWAYGDDFDDYYWVPGTWVLAPEIGFFWTPGYWGWAGGSFVFYEGYWGPQIGFYGGINYGFGYFGEGYEGGRWENGHFFYNRTVNNINVTEIHNVYNTTVINNTTVNHISYNGGNGGITARPTPQQEAVARERHVPPVPAQRQHAQEARTNPQQRASVNLGKPVVAATPKPGVLKGGGVVAARAAGAPYTPPANRGRNQPGNTAGENRPSSGSSGGSRPNPPVHVRDLPPAPRPSAPNTGNPKLDQKYQQQQEKQFAKQEQERQKLAQRQQKEDQRAQHNADEARRQQMEQRHQQQTQQLQQRHEQQQQQMQQRMQPPPQRQEQRPEPKRPPH